VFAKDRAHYAGPRIGDAEISFSGTVYDLAVVVDDDRFDPVVGSGRRSRLPRCRPRDRGQGQRRPAVVQPLL